MQTRILIIEDDPEISDLVGMHLEDQGYGVERAARVRVLGITRADAWRSEKTPQMGPNGAKNGRKTGG